MTVVIALIANVLVASAKTVAAVLTGSAAMFAEAAHSWADAGNEVFLVFADRAAARPRDRQHPLGFGRDAWLWSLFAAIGVFAVGATVSIFHGITELADPEPAGDYVINYIVLAVAFVLEGTSFLQSIRQGRKRARETGREFLPYVLGSSESTLRAVFAEDGAALIGIVLAAAGIALHQVTGIAAFDAIASILIGLLLAVVALFLIDRNRRFLIGGAQGGKLRDWIVGLLESRPEIDHVTYLHVEVVGPNRLFVVGAVDLLGDQPEHTVADKLRAIEDALEAEEIIQTAVLTVASYREPSIHDPDALLDADPDADAAR
ncbi:cation diffusion facilitator family transporter [Schumannella sp. 10F1B-5-1]|uniref:cation diffusion facilitator family transporter n=1 Tax=Schumannella sp. 10F1B-5-1 TaxID=2590780 RepID=UPI0021064383|nr:cation diffusion facilitator family transporter [Schumannella sp. 10F1B-5-1]